MRRPRFTIGGLLVLVLFLAFGFAAWRGATPVLEGSVFVSILLVLLFSVLQSVHQDRADRAFWFGFALFGSSYLILALIPPMSARLPTSWVLASLDSVRMKRSDGFAIKMKSPRGDPWGSPFESTIDGTPLTKAGTFRIWDATTGAPLSGRAAGSESFLRIGHSLLALVLAFVGAFESRHLHDRRRRRASATPAHETSTSSPTSSTEPEGSPEETIRMP